MKKTNLIFLGAALIILLTYCSKNSNKIEYSCNKDINNWVNTYKNEIIDIPREQLVTLPIGYQKAIYNTFSKERKAELWHEKLDIVLASNQDTEFENQIIALYNFISPDIYDRDIEEKPKDYIINFTNDWEQKVLGSFESDTLIFSIKFCTLMTLDEYFNYVENFQDFDYSWLEGGGEITMSGGGGGTNACSCRYDIYCSIFLTNICEDGRNNCTQNYNCGIAGNSLCDGQCQEEARPE